jgi:hypothetical protein
VLKYFNLTFKQTKCHSFYFGAKIQKRKRRTKVEVKIKIRTKIASCATPFRKTPVAVKFWWPERLRSTVYPGLISGGIPASAGAWA